MVYIGILAGGENIIFDANLPIQFMHLGEKPLIVHTIEQFMINEVESKLIIVVPSNLVVYSKDLLEKYVDSSNLYIIEGGKDKSKSVKKVVDFVEDNFGINDDDILISHDAIRPFVTQKIINENIALAQYYNAINTVVPVIDSIIFSEDGVVANEIPKTSKLYAEQTPQTFKLKNLKELISEVPIHIWENEVDLARLFTNSGEDVYLLKGEYSNIKIRTVYDLEVAKSLITEEE